MKRITFILALITIIVSCETPSKEQLARKMAEKGIGIDQAYETDACCELVESMNPNDLLIWKRRQGRLDELGI